MGILDALRYSTGNPDKDAQLNRGLLEAGLALLQSRGNLASALGQAGMSGLMASDRTRQGQQQQQFLEAQKRMQALQLGKAEREAKIDALPGQFYRAPSMPAVDATGGMETAVEAPNNASGPGGFDMGGYLQALQGIDPVRAMQIEASMQKPRAQLMNVAPGGSVFDPATGKPVYTAPFKPEGSTPTTIARLISERDALPANDPRRRVYDAMISKETTPAGPQTVVLGSPVPVQLPDGATGYVQPANRPGAAPQVLTDPRSGQPLTRPRADDEKPLTEGQAKALTFSSRMQASDKIIADLGKKGVNTSIPGSTRNSMLGDVLTAVSSADMQKLNQAKRDFANATLRRESGAVINPDEFANAERQYFPQIGDSPAVIKQKAANRRIAIEGVRADVPRGKQGEVDRIAGSPEPAASADPLGIRGR